MGTRKGYEGKMGRGKGKKGIEGEIGNEEGKRGGMEERGWVEGKRKWGGRGGERDGMGKG